MNYLDLNNYIDFSRMFLDLYHESKEEIENGVEELEICGLLRDFMIMHYDYYELMVEESQFDADKIVFVFGHDYDDANESCNQSTTSDFTFVYDRTLEQFTDGKYSQG